MSITIYVGNEYPSFQDTITRSDGSPVDLTGATVNLVCPELGIDRAAVILDAPNGVVRFDWASTETNTAGAGVAWWRVTTSGDDQDTPEFTLKVMAHGVLHNAGYANLEDVIGRGGFALSGITPATAPSIGDIDRFLQDVALEIDGYLAAKGFPVPATGRAAATLRSPNIDGALVLALEARYQGTPGTGADQPMPILEGARARWTAAVAALMAGTHPVMGVLTAPVETGSPSEAASFWDDEGDSFQPGILTGQHNPFTDPGTYRGMPL